MSIKSFEQDLKTFSKQDLECMFKYYNVNNLKDLSRKIKNKYNKKYNLPVGTIWDAIKNQDYDSFLEFVNDPTFNPNETKNGDPLLVYAVSLLQDAPEEITEPNIKIIEKLVEKGVDINGEDSNKYTPLIIAAGFSNTYSSDKVVETLLRLGADPNKSGGLDDDPIFYDPIFEITTPLHNAIRSNESTLQTIKLLLDYGATFNKNIFPILLSDNRQNEILNILSEYDNMDNDLSINTIQYNIYNKFKAKRINYLQAILNEYINLFSNNEKKYLLDECKFSFQDVFTEKVKKLKICINIAENMYEYRPYEDKAEKLAKKYEKHPYFQK